MPSKSMKFSNMSFSKKIIFLSVITVVGMILFVGMGLNANNFEFNISRRIPKILAILIVSYSIGYSSIIFQTITNNKILTPGVMGLDSLYIFIQTVVVFFFGSKQLEVMSDTTQFLISAFIMICSSLLIYVFLFNGEMRNIYYLILIGIVFGGLFNGLSNFMQVLLDPDEFLILQGKMFASFNNINVKLLGICLIVLIICIAISIKDLKKLDVLSLGEYHAINLGINYKLLVRKQFVIISLLVSISTVLVGPVIFLGLLIASLSREIFKSYKHSILILGAFVICSLALIYSLFIVERLLNFGTTMNVIINFIGGIYFIYIMLKENNS